MSNESRQQLRTIWAYRWWLGIFVAVVTVAAYMVSKRATPVYKATALVQVVSAAEASGQYLPSDSLQSLVNTYVRYAETPAVYASAANFAGLGKQPEAISGALSANPESGSGVLDLTASSPDPVTAAKYANAYAKALALFAETNAASQNQDTLSRIQDQIDKTTLASEAPGITPLQAAQLKAEASALRSKLTSTAAAPVTNVELLGPASAPGAPTSPKPKRNAILALIAALVIAIGVLLAYVAIADRYRDADEAASDLRLELLGELPRSRPDDQAAIEAFRRLRTAVTFALGRARSQIGVDTEDPAVHDHAMVLVSAAERGAGKSYTTAGLSRALSADGWHVLAMDGDLRRPTLHDQLGMLSGPGLGEVLAGEDVTRLIQHLPQSAGLQNPGSLDLLAAGTAGPDTTERLASPEMLGALQTLRPSYDYLLVDSSPILPVVDAVVLARYSQGVVIVVDARRSRRRDVRRAVQTLRATDTMLLGFVFNRSSSSAESYGYSARPAPASTARTGGPAELAS